MDRLHYNGKTGVAALAGNWLYGEVYGLMTDGTVLDLTSKSQTTITNAIQISSGGDLICALIKDGSVDCLGGQTGLGFPSTSSPVSGFESGVKAISSGWSSLCAVMSDSGGGNTGIGESALRGSTTNAVGVGLDAGYGSAGTASVYVGYNSGYGVQGSNNIGIGQSVFFSNGTGLTGAYNTVVGDSSMGSNVSGRTAADNSVLGATSLQNATSGSSNIVLGYSSANYITTGSSNILIGNASGNNSTTGITTGGSNILIGNSLNTPANNTGNFLNIGNTIYGNTSTGNVGIGTTAPGATLDVKGHFANSGATATIGTCGTSPTITGNDTRGAITLGTKSPTACTITFASAYATTPICVITPTGGDTGAVRWYVTPSTSALVVNFSATPTASQQFAYHCMQ